MKFKEEIESSKLVKKSLGESTCPVCGKIFYKKPGHVYKFVHKGRRIATCSWTCLNRAREAQQQNQIED